MASEVRLWRIADRTDLRELPQVRLDLEDRLEGWLVEDISILDPHLLVIGRQIATDFGGFIDLLCLDPVGDVVMVELKRGKTPREVTAQALDYGSWVAALSNERITTIAEAYLEGESLEEAFVRRFHDELPETLGQGHKLLVVGSAIDDSSERIINYLSGTHGVNINAATFQYFREEDGDEYLARVFVIEPSQVELRTRTKGGSKRRPVLTYDELQSVAEQNGVQDLYTRAVSGLERVLHKDRTRSSIRFSATLDGTRKVVINLFPSQSNEADGLRFRLYTARIRAMLGISDEELRALLPAHHSVYTTTEPEYAGYDGFFSTGTDVDRFVAAFVSVRDISPTAVDQETALT